MGLLQKKFNDKNIFAVMLGYVVQPSLAQGIFNIPLKEEREEMKTKQLLMLILIIFTWGCGQITAPEEKFYEGRIVIIGNMPFSSPALETGESIIKLAAPPAIEKELVKNQGYFYRVFYYFHHVDEFGTMIIKVTRVKKL